MSKQQFNIMSVQEIEELETIEHIELYALDDENNGDTLANFSLSIDELN